MKDTPSMRQYKSLKEQYKDCILFFRMGDFYETFDDDARIMARVLDIALTSRDRSEDKTPMAGIPHHALNRYLPIMIAAGYKVALCEQMENAKDVKGIVRRDVVKIITPGTVIETDVQNPRQSMYVLAIYLPKGKKDGKYGISYIDISKGSFYVFESDSSSQITDIIQNLEPCEIIYSENYEGKFYQGNSQEEQKLFSSLRSTALTSVPNFDFENGKEFLQNHFQVKNLNGFLGEELHNCLKAGGAVLKYVEDTQKNKVTHIEKVEELKFQQYMYLDASTIKNLEIFSDFSIKDNKHSFALIDIIDKTCTTMGTRLLRFSLIYPLIEKAQINKRLDLVSYFKEKTNLHSIRELLHQISDIERINTRISFLSASPRDFQSLKQSVKAFFEILPYFNQNDLFPLLLNEIYPDKIYQDKLKKILLEIETFLFEDASGIQMTSNFINTGVDKQLDELKDILINGKGWLKTFQQEEILKTGINSLKVHYNKIFGYYIEIPHSQTIKIPQHYERKQTLANAERYITPDLKEKEDLILHAEERIALIEKQLFDDFKKRMSLYVLDIKLLAYKCSLIDMLVNFAYIAKEYNYVKPNLTDEPISRIINLKDARHPVIERTHDSTPYIPNDIYLDCVETQLLLVTGPNMAGKSSILRMTALISLLAQIGSFVPAREATLSVVDRIFSRVGARDSLAAGESTFMVEMNETANILNNATDRSLIILDEIGRGTSTYDGVSIAYAVIEYIHERIHAKTIFATHYHELIDLENIYHRVKNYNVQVKEDADKIIFLRKLIRGGTDKSYGIHVAKIAGIPKEVTKRAQFILYEYEKIKEEIKKANIPPLVAMMKNENEKVTAFEKKENQDDQISDLLSSIDINALTPLEGLTLLHQIYSIVIPHD